MKSTALGLAVAALLFSAAPASADCGVHLQSNLNASAEAAPALSFRDGRLHLTSPLVVEATVDEIGGGLLHLETAGGDHLTIPQGLLVDAGMNDSVSVELPIHGARVLSVAREVPFENRFHDADLVVLETEAGPFWISRGVFEDEGFAVADIWDAMTINTAAMIEDDETHLDDMDRGTETTVHMKNRAEVEIEDDFFAEPDDDPALELDRSDTF